MPDKWTDDQGARHLTDDERREQKRERDRRWKAAHPEKVKEYRIRFREAHLEQVREENRMRERERAARTRRANATAERRRAKARERYASDPLAHNSYQLRRRTAQRAADPEGYRRAKNDRNRRWISAHRAEYNARLRLKYHDDPQPKRLANQRYYAEHGDVVRERKRAHYWAHREEQVQKQRQRRAREKRRRELGLPPRRLHRVLATDRAANTAAADAFFGRVRTPEEVRAIRREPKTSAHELSRWNRDSARARLAARIDADPERVRPVTASQRRKSEREADAHRTREADAAEQARMDAIARAINDRLRQQARRSSPTRRRQPRTIAPPPTGGLSL